MSVMPAAVTVQQGSTSTYQVKDTGDTDLTVTVAAVELRNDKDWLPGADYDHATVIPSSFTLNPGQSKTITVTIRSTDGLRHDIAVLASAKVAAVKSGASVDAALAARSVVEGKANPYAETRITLPASSAKGGQGFPAWVIPVAVAAALVVIGGSDYFLRSRQRLGGPR